MVTRSEAEDAVHTLLEYLESDSNREGLMDTPKRVIDSWDEVFAGYKTNAADLLEATFNAEGYDGIVLLSNIEFHSKHQLHSSIQTCQNPYRTKNNVGYTYQISRIHAGFQHDNLHPGQNGKFRQSDILLQGL